MAMRTPTPKDVLYAWHNAAIRGLKPQTTMEPQAGFFLTRFMPRGAPIPASIYMRQDIDPETGELCNDEIMCAEILGERTDPEETWLRCARRPICRLYYQHLLGKLL